MKIQRLRSQEMAPLKTQRPRPVAATAALAARALMLSYYIFGMPSLLGWCLQYAMPVAQAGSAWYAVFDIAQSMSDEGRGDGRDLPAAAAPATRYPLRPAPAPARRKSGLGR
jgi:hypothetical protein